MGLGLAAFQILPYCRRAHILLVHCRVQDFMGWPVGHQQVYFWGHSFPDGVHLLLGDLEGSEPVGRDLGVGTREDPDAPQLHQVMLQVGGPSLGQSGQLTLPAHIFGDVEDAEVFMVRGGDVGVEEDLVVAGDHQLVLEPEPLQQSHELPKVVPLVVGREVPRMDEDVARQPLLVGLLQFDQVAVGVRSGRNLHHPARALLHPITIIIICPSQQQQQWSG